MNILSPRTPHSIFKENESIRASSPISSLCENNDFFPVGPLSERNNILAVANTDSENNNFLSVANTHQNLRILRSIYGDSKVCSLNLIRFHTIKNN